MLGLENIVEFSNESHSMMKSVNGYLHIPKIK